MKNKVKKAFENGIPVVKVGTGYVATGMDILKDSSINYVDIHKKLW